jgi:hypothetical protein
LAAPKEIMELAERFEANKESYRQKQLPEARMPQDQTALQRRIEATDRQIDALVYELYRLTEEEIGIVEDGMRSSRRLQGFASVRFIK